MLSLRFFGAAGGVTGSRYEVAYGSRRFLVDCGMYQGADERDNFLPFDRSPKDYDALLLTHAHMDHSGLIPRWVAEGFNSPILCTFPSYDLCRLLLLDSAKIQEEEADDLSPLYDREDALDALELVEGCRYGRSYPVIDGVRVRFRDASHILGSAWLELDFEPLPGWPGPIRMVFSGDIGRGNSPLLSPAEQPERADFLVLESTYGNRLHGTTPLEDELAEMINEASDAGSPLIIPAFAVQRSQELAYVIEELWRSKRVDGLDVYLDSPMAVRSLRVYEQYPDHLAPAAAEKLNQYGTLLRYPYLHLCETADQSRQINAARPPFIVLSASGMCEGGRVLHHLRRYLPDPNARILLAGYQAEGTRGRQLEDGARELEVQGRMLSVQAQILRLRSSSGHADYKEIGDWLSRLQEPPRRTFLVHGEDAARLAQQARLAGRGWSVEVPQRGQEFILCGA